MSDFTVYDAAPDDFEAAGAEDGVLFGGAAWQGLLERCFGIRTLYAWNGSAGAAISVFRAGPFRVGYATFPVGGGVGSLDDWAPVVAALRERQAAGAPVCLRVPLSPFAAPVRCDFRSVVNPETAIPDLGRWNADAVSKRLRRDLRKARASGLEVTRLGDPAAGAELHALYAASVRRQGGSPRYTAGYFRGLLELAGDTGAIRVLAACDGPTIAGFAVTAKHGTACHYLHAGAAPAYRSASPSDLLLGAAIDDAQAQGCELFNLMASPADQPQLVAYKEKWGAVTRDLHTGTAPLAAGYPLFRLAERIYKLLR